MFAFGHSTASSEGRPTRQGERDMFLKRSLCCDLLITAGMNHLPDITHLTATLLISLFAPFAH